MRPAVDDDAPAIARIYIESWNSGFGDILGERALTDAGIERWERDLADACVAWTVAEADGEIAGFVGVRPSRDPADPSLGEVDTIAVDPARWRGGIGRMLMSHALDQLRQRYLGAVLWTVADYSRGYAFYRATGWRLLEQSRADGAEVAFGHSLR